MKTIIIAIVIGMLAGCAGNGNSIWKEVPSADRILKEMPHL
jgi:hypothetical protein